MSETDAARGGPAGAGEGRRPGGTPCVACVHLYTTWRPERPRGCGAYGFESRTWPSLVVQQTSGTPCQLFAPRPPHGGGAPPDGSGSPPPHRSRRPGGLYG